MSMPARLSSHEPKPRSASAGSFVAIWRGAVVGPWKTYQDALRSGYDEFGMAPFVVRRAENAVLADAMNGRAAA